MIGEVQPAPAERSAQVDARLATRTALLVIAVIRGRACRVCGCTERRACAPDSWGVTCWWVCWDVCSRCAGRKVAHR